MSRAKGYLRLMRLPNIITAISDIIAGVAIAGSLISVTWGSMNSGFMFSELLFREGTFVSYLPILLLIISTIGLYGGGVVLNDVFDADLDKTERPERPIPSGLIAKRSAAIFGTALLLIGIAAATLTNKETIFSAPALLATF